MTRVRHLPQDRLRWFLIAMPERPAAVRSVPASIVRAGPAAAVTADDPLHGREADAGAVELARACRRWNTPNSFEA